MRRKVERAPVWLHRSRTPLPLEFEDARSDARAPEIESVTARFDAKLYCSPIQRVGRVYRTRLEGSARPRQHHRAAKVHRESRRDHPAFAANANQRKPIAKSIDEIAEEAAAMRRRSKVAHILRVSRAEVRQRRRISRVTDVNTEPQLFNSLEAIAALRGQATHLFIER